MMSNNKVLRVPITNDRDLILTIDFDKKIIEIESTYWTTIAKRKGIESPDTVATIPAADKKQIAVEIDDSKEIKPNKKVMPSLEERTLGKVMEIFDSLSETSFNEGGVSSKILRETLQNKKVVNNYQEFTRFLNMAIEKDLIEYMQDSEYKGMYKRKS